MRITAATSDRLVAGVGHAAAARTIDDRCGTTVAADNACGGRGHCVAATCCNKAWLYIVNIKIDYNKSITC